VEREGEVRPPRAEIDNTDGTVGKRRDDVVDELDEAVDLPELRPTLGPDTAVRRLDAELDQERHRLPLREHVALHPVVHARRTRPRRRLAQDSWLATTREHLPVGVRRVEEGLPVVLPDRRTQQPSQSSIVEVLVGRPRPVMTTHRPALAALQCHRLDGDARRLVRACCARTAQGRPGQRRAAHEQLDEVVERHSAASATMQIS
jgi:hypothetical protein